MGVVQFRQFPSDAAPCILSDGFWLAAPSVLPCREGDTMDKSLTTKTAGSEGWQAFPRRRDRPAVA